MVITSRRVPWVALALSFLSAGVGHLYCGRIVKGLPLYFAWLLVPLGITIARCCRPRRQVSCCWYCYLLSLSLSCICTQRLMRGELLLGLVWTTLSAITIAPAIYSLLIVVQMIYSIGLIAGVRGLRLRSVSDSNQQHESDHSSRRPHPGEKAVDARSRSRNVAT